MVAICNGHVIVWEGSRCVAALSRMFQSLPRSRAVIIAASEQGLAAQAYRELLTILSKHANRPLCLADAQGKLMWSNSAWG